MSFSNIKLSVIVLFFHGEKWIHPCVLSLERQTLPRDSYEILLIDNGGSTPSVEKFKGRDNFQVLHLSQNYGFTGGNNRALSHARGEIIFLMNQDTIAHADCLKSLLFASDLHPEAGIVAANMRMVSQADRVDPKAPFDYRVGIYNLSRLGYASYHIKKTRQGLVPVDFVSGNGLAIRREILKDIGQYLFDERLGSYAEDLDLSIRLNKTKWKMFVCPRAVIYHYRDEAFNGKPLDMLKKYLHISTNRLIVYHWNFKTIKFLKNFPALLIGIPIKTARSDNSESLQLVNLFVSFLILPVIILFFIMRLRRILNWND